MTAQADEPLNRTEAKPRKHGWHSIDWREAYREVRRLQIRISKAVKEGKWHKVRGLIRLLSRSFYAKALAVKKVTENKGKKTPGIDNILWDTPNKKWKGIGQLETKGYRPMPLRRIHIPKQNGKKRPISIPVMKDRAFQALYQLGLDPISETLADPNSYGFRRERCCQDAIEQVFNCLAHKGSAELVLEGDIRSCFSEISHQWLEKKTQFCGGIIRKWLKAGYMYKGKLFPTKAGTPQGGLASPTLMNLTLDDLERTLKEKFRKPTHKVHFIRYCDDFIITGSNREIVGEVMKTISEFLMIRGLTLSEEKTIITHIKDGFDFLGWNVRKYKSKLIIKPSKPNVQRFMSKIRQTIKLLRTAKQEALIRTLNPKIRGWANYHKSVCSKKTFSKVDHMIWETLWRWCKRRHPKKNKEWIVRKYFHSENGRNWIFGVKDKSGNWISRLTNATDIPIRRHVKIKGETNPYDPIYEQYLEARQTKKWEHNTQVKKLRTLWKKQKGRCPICEQMITTDSYWEQHHKIRRVDGGPDTLDNLVLLHRNCHTQIHCNPNLITG